MLMNPSLHAVVLIRLSQGCPPWIHWFWRNILISKHSMDVSYGVEIGPGLFLPHPHTITVAPGVKLGARCQLLNGITIGAGVGAERCPRLGDDVVVMLGAVILGDLEIGDGCIVGAYAWVDSDMPPGSLAVAPKATIAEGKGERMRARIAPGSDGAGVIGAD
jgi:serine O-acetyltransferase